MSNGKLLIIDDGEDILYSLKLLLEPNGYEFVCLNNPEGILDKIKKESFDAILLDMNFTKNVSSGDEGYYWLDKILSLDKEAVVILMTAYFDTAKAVKAIKKGASDFISKPWENDKLLATISSACKLTKARKEIASEKKNKVFINKADSKNYDFIGESKGMQDVFALIEKVAPTDANILILGENGTGKELVARAIHQQSKRNNQVFITADLGSITETLFESEIFGHMKGAFTDAKNDKPGRFELADGGSFFMDEIGNLSLPLQSKLLTVLERREVTRLGSTNSKKIDTRVICATNADINEMVAKGHFRQDLLYRINTVELHLPPLRERGNDISILSNFFLERFSKKYKKDINGISKTAENILLDYKWPGNIRELQHCIERAVILSEGKELIPEDFALNNNSFDYNDKHNETYNLEEVEKNIIRKVLTQQGGNITKTAQILGLTRNSLYRRMEKHGL